MQAIDSKMKVEQPENVCHRPEKYRSEIKKKRHHRQKCEQKTKKIKVNQSKNACHRPPKNASYFLIKCNSFTKKGKQSTQKWKSNNQKMYVINQKNINQKSKKGIIAKNTSQRLKKWKSISKKNANYLPIKGNSLRKKCKQSSQKIKVEQQENACHRPEKYKSKIKKKGINAKNLRNRLKKWKSTNQKMHILKWKNTNKR